LGMLSYYRSSPKSRSRLRPSPIQTPGPLWSRSWPCRCSRYWCCLSPSARRSVG
jgi:hypothetical protein